MGHGVKAKLFEMQSEAVEMALNEYSRRVWDGFINAISENKTIWSGEELEKWQKAY